MHLELPQLCSLFKGLEAQAVVLWIGDEVVSDEQWETVYVGTTRAKSLLTIVGSRGTLTTPRDDPGNCASAEFSHSLDPQLTLVGVASGRLRSACAWEARRSTAAKRQAGRRSGRRRARAPDQGRNP
ncbi:MAG: ATP-binding domain-containing protein [Thiomonas arsenitoxydans]|uniref:ATP-binding domain-containing protein n=1 Tax=Thiomonas arsenitoxydans (strain DSM 22701 / CIP 110005 / 3As) TaxID=426114 RepID=A0A8I1MXZ3_THIA3|nr:ATP-binding domain-containing protein [Thiomonas arsenitoxydans]